MKTLKCSKCRKHFKNNEKGIQVVRTEVYFDSAVYYGEVTKTKPTYAIPFSNSLTVKHYHVPCARRTK